MLPDYRRPLLRPEVTTALAKLVGEARQAHAQAVADLHAQAFEHRCAISDMQAEVTELREILHDVTVIVRQQADCDVATLRRQLQAVLLRLTRRDPAQPLN
jgi:hypothetical protein